MRPEQFIKEIAQEIVSGRCIPFIGAGFSALAEYPTWKELLKQIIREHQKLSSNPSDLKDADIYLESNKLQDAANFLSSKLEDCKSLACGIIHSHDQRQLATAKIKKSVDLRKWNCATLITTNYDNLIESLLAESDPKYISICSMDSNIISRGNKIIHLHGDYDHPADIVFSESDITEKILDNHSTTRYLDSLILHNTILFFGYSINEPHIRPLLFGLAKMRGKADRYHYAILGINKQESTTYENTHKLRILELNPDNNYKDTRGHNLLEILGEITAECLKLQKANSEKIARDVSEAILSNYDEEIKETIGKISKLADLQKIHVPVKALITMIVNEGLEIINDRNKTFTIHVVEGDKMRIIAEGGADARKARKSESRNRDKNQGLIGRVYRDNLPFNCANVALSPEYYEGNPLTKSEFVVPLRDNEGNVFGVLNIESTEKNDFDSSKDCAILEAVAQQVSISLRNKKKYDLKELSLAVCRKTYVENELGGRLHSGIDPLVKLFTKTLRDAIDHDVTDKNRLVIRGGIIKTPIATDSHRKDSIIIVAPGDFNKEEIINNVQDDISDIERAIIHETSARSTKRNNLYYYICDDLLCHYVLYLNSNYSFILDEDLNEALQVCVTHIGDNLRYLNKTREQHELIRELNLVKKLIHLSETEPDENKLLHAVSINVCSELEVDWCFIYTYNPVAGYGSKDPLRYDMKTVNFISGGVTLDEFEKKSYTPGDGLTGLVLEEENFVTSDDVFTDGRSSKKNTLPFKSRNIEISAFLGYPIRFEKPLIPENKTASKLTKTIGIITLGRKEKFGRKEKETIKIISTFIGKELERRRLIIQQELFHNYTTLLNLLPEKLATCGTEELVLKAVDEFVPKYLKEQYYSIFRLEPDLTLKMKSPQKYVENMDIHPPTFCIDEPEGLTNKIIRDGKPIFRLNFDQGKKECRNFWSSIVGTDDRYFIGVPIKHPMNENEYYGVFTLNGRKPATFDPHFCESVTVEVVKSVASQISFALSRTCHKT